MTEFVSWEVGKVETNVLLLRFLSIFPIVHISRFEMKKNGNETFVNNGMIQRKLGLGHYIQHMQDNTNLTLSLEDH